MSYHKFQAKLALAWLFLGHLIKRVLFFWKRSDGLTKFLATYSGDAIFPVSLGERSAFPSYQRCQVCSLCTFSCAAIKEGKAPSSFEPKFLMIGYGRSSHESEYFIEDWLPCLECVECTVDCPNDVPVHAMGQQIVERRNRLGFRQSERDRLPPVTQ